jgi:hypothetical protein
MLDTKITQQALNFLVLPSSNDHGEVDRLMAAAVINQHFCRLLLTDPARAICEGYQGENFLLSPEEFSLLVSLNASSLAELANLIAHAFGEQQQDSLRSPAPSFIL